MNAPCCHDLTLMTHKVYKWSVGKLNCHDESSLISSTDRSRWFYKKRLASKVRRDEMMGPFGDCVESVLHIWWESHHLINLCIFVCVWFFYF